MKFSLNFDFITIVLRWSNWCWLTFPWSVPAESVAVQTHAEATFTTHPVDVEQRGLANVAHFSDASHRTFPRHFLWGEDGKIILVTTDSFSRAEWKIRQLGEKKRKKVLLLTVRLHHHHSFFLRHNQLTELISHVGKNVLGSVKVEPFLNCWHRQPQAHSHGVALLRA